VSAIYSALRRQCKFRRTRIRPNCSSRFSLCSRLEYTGHAGFFRQHGPGASRSTNHLVRTVLGRCSARSVAIQLPGRQPLHRQGRGEGAARGALQGLDACWATGSIASE
jgi:hypothetical protein